MTVVNFEYERLKRLNHDALCLELLEGLFENFLGAERDAHESLLAEFIEGLDLGSKPLSHFVQAYYGLPNIQFIVDTIISKTSPDVLANLVEFIELCWPQESKLVHRLKVLLIGFGIKKLDFDRTPFLPDLIQSYIQGASRQLEDMVIAPTSNIVQFPPLSPSYDDHSSLPLQTL